MRSDRIDRFLEVFINIIDIFSPCKESYLWVNNVTFTNKNLLNSQGNYVAWGKKFSKIEERLTGYNTRTNLISV